MGVHGTYCQLCGLPTQHDHYVPTGGMLKIYRGSSENGGHEWEADEHPFPFGPEHAWLKDAVVLPWDDDRVLRGPVADGAIEDVAGSVLVFAGDDEGLAFHHACWKMQGSPRSTGPAVRGNGTHAWALVEAYQDQLFEFQELAADGKAWMLADPGGDARSRARIEAILAMARREVTEPAKGIEEVVVMDRDWCCMAVRDKRHARTSLIRARLYAIQEVPKTGYAALVRVTRPGVQDMTDGESFEVALKSAAEREARAVLVVVGIGKGRAEHLVYARDAAKTQAELETLPGAKDAVIEVSDDPEWTEATALIRSLGPPRA